MSKIVEFKFDQGIRLKDRVTGFVGIVDQRLEMLNGCLRYSITGTTNEKGEYQGYYVDEAQLEYVDEGLQKNPIEKNKTGGAVTKSRSMNSSKP
jgi:hypothetical protein